MNQAVSIPGYRVIRPLGVGGMASVYLAVQESLDREVALKVMAPALAANQEFTERFLKEGRITAKLSHPNLVTVFDIGQHGTLYYLAAEYVPGGTLRDKLTAGIRVDEALGVVRDVAQGLHYAHQKGFVHRDVKPGNVLFRANGSAVLADFGIAKSIDQTSMATQVGNSIGTPHYMSPEQARAEKVDGRSDLYSLGSMLFELLTGHPPYEADDPFSIALMHVTKPIPQLPEEHRWLQPLIDGLMAKSPADRFVSGEAFVAALERLIRAERGVPGPDTQRAARVRAKTHAPSASQPGSPRARALWLGAALLLVVAAAAAGYGWWMPRETAVTADPAAPVPTDRTPVSQDIPAADLAVATQTDVTQWLEKAQAYVRQGLTENGRRLSAPPGDCAVDLFWRVLQVEANNPQAKAGLEQIADFYESKAKAAFDRGYYSGSMVLAEEGLKANPDRASLKKIVDDSKREAGL